MSRTKVKIKITNVYHAYIHLVYLLEGLWDRYSILVHALIGSDLSFSCWAHWENYIFISFHIEWDMIVVTAFLPILNQMEIHLVQSRKENCLHDHIPFNEKENGNIVFAVQWKTCSIYRPCTEQSYTRCLRH